MRLTEISIDGVRGVTVSARLAETGSLVVTGAAGAGKTAFLEAIVAAKESAGAYGLPPHGPTFSPGGRGRVKLLIEVDDPAGGARPRVPIDWDLSLGPTQAVAPELSQRLRRYSLSPADWKVEYFHAGRSISDSGLDPEESALRLSKSPQKYGFVPKYLSQLALQEAAHVLAALRRDGMAVAEADDAPRSRFTTSLTALAPGLRWDGAGDHGDVLGFVRRDGTRASLSELADSERMLVLFAASWAALGLERSLVLVDQPELGIHPAQHVALFDGLCWLARAGQLIVTTTSPAILRHVPQSSVVVLDA